MTFPLMKREMPTVTLNSTLSCASENHDGIALIYPYPIHPIEQTIALIVNRPDLAKEYLLHYITFPVFFSLF